MAKFKKKPVVIEAELFTGAVGQKIDGVYFVDYGDPRGKIQGFGAFVDTLEGPLKVSFGDWIIKGVNGELYPCKPDIFDKTYEPVDE